MKKKNAALIACGLVAGALTATGAFAKDKDSSDDPLKVVDAAGRYVGRLYGNAKGDFVAIRLNNAMGSLRLVEDGPYLMPAQSTVFSAAPHCAGSWVIPAGGSVPGTGLPSMPAIGSVKGADQRFTLYLPTSSTVHRITVYSQGQYGGPCSQFSPVPLYGVPAEAASLVSYFVLPFHIE